MEFGFLAWKSIHGFLGNHLSVLGEGTGSWSEVCVRLRSFRILSTCSSNAFFTRRSKKPSPITEFLLTRTEFG